MTTDDLAWVQSRLRNCTNARRQLRICAECLYVDEGTLLESLGYASLDAFRAAHPQNKRSCGPSVERIYNPVPPEAIRHRVCNWKKKHPTLAAGMPHKRPKPKKETEAMKMTYDEAGLPAYAYARSRYTNNIVRIVRGERTLFGVVEQETVDTLNEAAGVTRAQAAAMYGGAMCGWDSPMADPKNYNEAGAYIGPEMEDKDGEE